MQQRYRSPCTFEEYLRESVESWPNNPYEIVCNLVVDRWDDLCSDGEASRVNGVNLDNLERSMRTLRTTLTTGEMSLGAKEKAVIAESVFWVIARTEARPVEDVVKAWRIIGVTDYITELMCIREVADAFQDALNDNDEARVAFAPRCLIELISLLDTERRGE